MLKRNTMSPLKPDINTVTVIMTSPINVVDIVSFLPEVGVITTGSIRGSSDVIIKW